MLSDSHLLRVSLPYYHYYYHQHVKDSSSTNNNDNINWNYSFGNIPRLRLIKAVAAAAPQNPPGGIMFDLSEEEEEEEEEPLDEKEQLRRLIRISKANKGRKHTLETLQKIKERTRPASQNPKVKVKSAAGMRKLLEKRREMKIVQETCFFEWKNLIAEASRQGLVGQKELRLNSYETLNEKLKQEWLVSLEERKHCRSNWATNETYASQGDPHQQPDVEEPDQEKQGPKDLSLLTDYHKHRANF